MNTIAALVPRIPLFALTSLLTQLKTDASAIVFDHDVDGLQIHYYANTNTEGLAEADCIYLQRYDESTEYISGPWCFDYAKTPAVMKLLIKLINAM